MTNDRKNIPDEIYRGFDRWHLGNLPPIERRRNHTILFKFPLSNDLSQLPEPYVGDKKWDVNHVRLPCAIQNVIETKYVVRWIYMKISWCNIIIEITFDIMALNLKLKFGKSWDRRRTLISNEFICEWSVNQTNWYIWL